jgi:hypothetical protein
MTKPVSAVPNIFASATSTIPLSQLDSDFSTIIGYLNDLSNYGNYGVDIGTANSIVVNFASGITTSSLTAGLPISFKASNSNTSTCTLTVQVNSSSIGSATIKAADGSNLAAGTITSGGIYNVVYDGTNFRLASGAGSGAVAGGAIYENTQSIASNYTITAGKNAFSVGPITVSSGVTVTVSSGSRWVVL